MQPHMQGEKLHSELLDELVLNGVKGGQFSDGSQKDGFFRYAKGKPSAVIVKDSNEYIDLAGFSEIRDKWTGELLKSALPWKNLVKLANKEELLISYFEALRSMNTNGAVLAVAYARNSRETALKLVNDGVALSGKDVNTVLLTGFFHAYGPINDFVK